MRRTLCLLPLILLSLAHCASAQQQDQETQIQKNDVPAAVLAAFAKAYPNATVRGYAREVEKNQTMYEVECVEGKTHRDVTYSPHGELLLVEESVAMKDVPPAVRQALSKRYPKAKVRLAEKLMDGKTVEYEFHLTANGKEAEARFDAQGSEAR